MADFQEFYGLNTEDFGKTISLKRAAALAAQLPHKSRCAMQVNPDLSWDDQTRFISNMEYLLRIENYSHSKDAKHGINKPQPNPSPSKRADINRRIDAANPEEVAEALGISI